MTRKILVAGNWKMNGLLADAATLAQEVATAVKQRGHTDCEILVCPPFTALATVKECLQGSPVALGAQDCHMAEKGAHTGDISAEMLKDAGCSYVIVGHSERRADHFESNDIVLRKAEAAHRAGLKVIICIGETEAERDAGETIDVCARQILGSVPADSTADNTVIAYEPVWAIGTGKTPTTEDVEEVHAAIRGVIAQKLGETTAANMRLLYGGSMKPGNAAGLVALADVDGGLIGGASLKAADFMSIIDAVCKK